MRVITTVTEVFTYDELSDEAKQAAIEEFSTDPNLYWSGEDNAASLKAFCNMVGIKPDWEVGTWGHSYCHPIMHDYGEQLNEFTDLPDLVGLRLRTWLINNYDHVLTTRRGYGDYKKNDLNQWRYQHRSHILKRDNDCPFTGMYMDESLLQPIRSFIAAPTTNETFSGLIQDCLNKWVEDYVSDLEYTYSHEGIAEMIEVNEYEFTEAGVMV